ncbi:flagellar brake protein [Heyndrickxia acidiproducens]|uniref:flagellar brake protein n=1 Tax=Heyndrickxia acidiproducens TaxID=1121084 RepID=UPI0003676B2A|nr:PilZ domain-containing protein [Heyndrickxia acidiproducens]
MLKIGMPLMLEAKDSGKKYKCKVADIRDGRLFIDDPIDIETNRTQFLLNQEVMDVEFVSDENIAWRFTGKIIGREYGSIPLLVMLYPEESQIRKIQRRQYVRVETALDIAIRFPKSDLKIITITKDISSGGCAVFLPEDCPVKVNDEGHARIVLPMKEGHQYLRLMFSVVRLFENNGKACASFQFFHTSALERQKIMRYCFEQQILLRKKGLAD